MGRLEDRALELFDELCDLGREAQVRRLQEIGTEDPGLRADVEELLAGDRVSDRRLEAKAVVPPSLLPVGRGADQSDEARRIVERLVARTRPFEHYRIEGEVGRGGMGQVLEVWDEDLERRLAMKVIAGEGPRASPDAVASDSRAMTRFLDEARVTSQLDHPGIVPVHELGLDSQGRVYFTMKLVRGRTLKEVFELVAEGKEDWSQTRALGVLLKVCEALAYAHSKDVVHRDLKPANVMVGRFGEVYVMDWGVARVRGKADVRDLRPRRRTSKRDETGVLALESPVVTMDGTVVGTPYYMPPEQAAGRMGEVDARSDVYALGAMLYHLLAGQPPYAESERDLSPHAVLARVLDGPPPPLLALAADASVEICAICEKAMAREPADRYADTSALADDLRAYLERRVVKAYQTGALAELRKWVERNKALAASAAAAVLLLIVGLTTSLAFKARSERNANLAQQSAVEAGKQAQVAREEMERAEKKTGEVLQLSALQDLEDLLARADQLWPAHPEKIPALALWIDDARKLLADLPVHRKRRADLRSKVIPQSAEERLADRENHPEYPRWGELEGELETAVNLAAGATTDEGIRVAEQKLATLEEERNRLDRRLGERRDWRFPEEEREARWWNNQLSKLIEGLEELERGLLAEDGTTAVRGWSIPKRLSFAREVVARSVTGPDATARWAEAIASIRDRAHCPEYDGLALKPQLGLVPIGRDPTSGLWEFAHLQTGEPAEREPDGKLVVKEETGLVFVLIPGGTFWMGAQKADPEGRNYDPQALVDDGPVHEVTLLPYFLSKYEMTQGQWLRTTGGNPSAYGPERFTVEWNRKRTGWNALHPVERVSWANCRETLNHLSLDFPTEAQWEHACRAGTSSVFWSGTEPESLQGVANLSDAFGKSHGNENWGPFEAWLDDGQSIHAEIGSYRANAFGLHDVHGNVWEWCRDGFDDYTEPVRPGDGERLGTGSSPRLFRAFRGGSFTNRAASARSASRGFAEPSFTTDDLGLRPSRIIER